MRKIIRLYLVSTFSLWITNQWFPQGLVITNNILTLLQAGLALMLANSIIKPLFSLIMLPINLITFGMFRWITNVVMLYLVVSFIQGINIHSFRFNGLNYAGIIIPPINFTTWMAWIFIPFVISIISGFLIWLFKK